MIQINEPLVIAQTQDLEILKVEVNFLEEVIDVSYCVKNEAGVVVKGDTVRFSGQEAQDFWTGFVSKTALYELLLNKLNISVTISELPDTL